MENNRPSPGSMVMPPYYDRTWRVVGINSLCVFKIDVFDHDGTGGMSISPAIIIEEMRLM